MTVLTYKTREFFTEAAGCKQMLLFDDVRQKCLSY